MQGDWSMNRTGLRSIQRHLFLIFSIQECLLGITEVRKHVSFGLPSVTNTGKQRKWLISNAVLSVQRQKRAFLDALGLSRATTAAAKQRKSLNSIEVQRQKRGFWCFLACQVLQMQANNANGLFPMPSTPSKDEKGLFVECIFGHLYQDIQ